MSDNEIDEKYKTISSGSDTRNPTTTKKPILISPKQQKNNKFYMFDNKKQRKSSSKQKRSRSMTHKNNTYSHSLSKIQQAKQQCLRSSRYKQAKYLDSVLTQYQRKRAKTQMKILLKQQKQQRKLIKNAHLRQMNGFEIIWHNHFIGLKAKQQMALIEFKRQQKKDIQQIQNNLIRRCQSLKLNSSGLKQLQKKQKLLKKQQNYSQLQILQVQRCNLKCVIISNQQQKIYSWAKQSQSQLKSYHTKRYNNLIYRLEETYGDQVRKYQREENRLKRKYHHVLGKLKHIHLVEMGHTHGNG